MTSEQPADPLPLIVTVEYSKPAPAPGTTVLHGLNCSTCGVELVVPLFHHGQADITDHKPTLRAALAAAPPESRWPTAATLERILPKCLAEADPAESDEGDWIGSEYVMRLADAILAALREGPER